MYVCNTSRHREDRYLKAHRALLAGPNATYQLPLDILVRKCNAFICVYMHVYNHIKVSNICVQHTQTV